MKWLCCPWHAFYDTSGLEQQPQACRSVLQGPGGVRLVTSPATIFVPPGQPGSKASGSARQEDVHFADGQVDDVGGHLLKGHKHIGRHAAAVLPQLRALLGLFIRLHVCSSSGGEGGGGGGRSWFWQVEMRGRRWC